MRHSRRSTTCLAAQSPAKRGIAAARRQLRKQTHCLADPGGADSHGRGLDSLEGGHMARSRLPRRFGLVLLLLVGLMTVPWAGAASGSSTPTCFGRAATMVGSGVIVGTSGDDVIVGSAGDDEISAGAGNDRVCSLEGNDLVRGELADDRADGGPGNDRMRGDLADFAGDVTADGGNDVLLGGSGNDSILGDHRVGGVVSGNGGNDTIEGGPGSDNLLGDSVAVTISGRGGNDTLDSGPDDDVQIVGDNLTGGGLVSGGGGNDAVTGGSGSDGFLVGDSGTFLCEGVVSGDDQLFGDAGDDQLHGDNHTDTGDPVVDSGDGTDACAGGAGIDTAALCESVTGVP